MHRVTKRIDESVGIGFARGACMSVIMLSRGGVTGGLTILDAIRGYEARGYLGQFAAREGGAMECFTCHRISPPSDVRLDSLRRIEGVSDPADMALVAALKCPNCGAEGTATFKYGPGATPEEGEALRLIEDVRACMAVPSMGVGEMIPRHARDAEEHLTKRGLDYNDEVRGPGM